MHLCPHLLPSCLLLLIRLSKANSFIFTIDSSPSYFPQGFYSTNSCLSQIINFFCFYWVIPRNIQMCFFHQSKKYLIIIPLPLPETALFLCSNVQQNSRIFYYLYILSSHFLLNILQSGFYCLPPHHSIDGCFRQSHQQPVPC